ncbi:MAG: VWA domain-containing protein [Elusimicrobiota bacterium]
MFLHPSWLVLAVPTLLTAALLSAWAASRRAHVAETLGRIATLARASEDAGAGRTLAFRLRLAALACLLAALAGPQWGVELVETRADMRQVVVAIDVSLSMQSQDIKPNRLARAKESLSLLLDQLSGERVGIVAFAGDAQTVCPLTHDIEAAKQLLSSLEVGAIPTPGTAIGSAIRTGTAMIGRYTGTKTLVLLTDGEDHASDPPGAAREAVASGVRVFTVGIGTAEGEPIPLEGGGYKKNTKGSTVISRLGEETLTQTARTTGGDYYRSSPGMDEIAQIVSKIKAGLGSRGLSGTATRWQNRYAWPLCLAFLLICLEMALPILPLQTRAPRAALVALAALACAATTSSGAMLEGTLRAGNKKYAVGKFDDALTLYGDASGLRPSDARPLFNAGDALYRLERDEDAAAAFAAAASHREAPRGLRADALYNLGNARLRSEDYAQAAAAYRRALALSPGDEDARHNLILALHHKKNPPPKQDKKNNKKKPQPEPNEKDKGDKDGDPQKPPPRTRPQDSMSREDAERVLRAVADREKSLSSKKAPEAVRGRPPKPNTQEDW